MKTPLATTIAILLTATLPSGAETVRILGSEGGTPPDDPTHEFVFRTSDGNGGWSEVATHKSIFSSDQYGSYSTMQHRLSSEEGEWQWYNSVTAHPIMALSSDMGILRVRNPWNTNSGAQLMGNGSLSLTNSVGGYSILAVQGFGTGTRRMTINGSNVVTDAEINSSLLRTSSGSTTVLLFGTGSLATGDHAVSLGKQTESNGEASVAMGKLAIARADTSVAIGYNTYAGYAAPSSVVIGHSGVTNAAYSVSLGLANQTDGAYSTAVGWGNWIKVGGGGGTALGALNRVEGNGASAIGAENTARGPYSTAIGYKSETGASAWGALSVGNSNITYSPASTALGQSNITTGYASVATGMHTQAVGVCQFVVGSYNAPIADYSSVVRNDDDALFIVGNGYEQTPGDPATALLRNAFVVHWNGRTEIFGNIEAKAAGTTSQGNITAAGAVTATGGLNVANTLTTTASTLADGSRYVKVRPGTTLLVPQSGDIDMGEFTAGPQPGE